MERKGAQAKQKSVLETEKISRLLLKFCVPSLASSLVTCLYNIIDQLFIGNVLGVPGNAATNVVFPVVTLLSALSLMCGVGASNAMNINRGSGEIDEAGRCVGGGFGLMILCGIACMVPMLLWTEKILYLFGATASVLPYASTYARIIALAFVFSVVSAAGPFLVRADGSPNFSLAIVAVGAGSNILLDALFIFGFHWGIAGAAWATLLAQVISTAMVVWYMRKRFSSIKLKWSDFRPDGKRYLQMIGIGIGPAFNFGTQAIVQIFLNNALRTYGAQSVYGSEICLAAAGVANKVNTLANAVVVGMTNGMQPIVAYNFGKKNYERVTQAAKTVVVIVLGVGCVIWIGYQWFAVPITAFFGEGDARYFEFAQRFFRIFFLLIPLYGLQSSVAGFFSAQGKVKKAVAISMVRQVLFFPPLLILLPKVMGIQGVLWSGPLSDLAMAVTAGSLFVAEIKK